MSSATPISTQNINDNYQQSPTPILKLPKTNQDLTTTTTKKKTKKQPNKTILLTTNPSTTTSPKKKKTKQKKETPLKSVTSQSPQPQSFTPKSPSQSQSQSQPQSSTSPSQSQPQSQPQSSIISTAISQSYTPDQTPPNEEGSPQSIEENVKQMTFVPSCTLRATICGYGGVGSFFKYMNHSFCESRESSFTCTVPTVFSTPSYLNLYILQPNTGTRLKSMVSRNTNNTDVGDQTKIKTITDINGDLKTFWKLSRYNTDIGYWLYDFTQLLQSIYTKHYNYLHEDINIYKNHPGLKLTLTGGGAWGDRLKYTVNASVNAYRDAKTKLDTAKNFTKTKLNTAKKFTKTNLISANEYVKQKATLAKRVLRFNGYKSLDSDKTRLIGYQTQIKPFITHVEAFVGIIPKFYKSNNTLSENCMVAKRINEIIKNLPETTIPTKSDDNSITFGLDPLIPNVPNDIKPMKSGTNVEKNEELAKMLYDSNLNLQNKLLVPLSSCVINIQTDLHIAYSAIHLLIRNLNDNDTINKKIGEIFNITIPIDQKAYSQQIDIVKTQFEEHITTTTTNIDSVQDKMKEITPTFYENLKNLLKINKKDKTPALINIKVPTETPKIKKTLTELLTELKNTYLTVMTRFHQLYEILMNQYLSELKDIGLLVDACVLLTSKMYEIINVKNLINPKKNITNADDKSKPQPIKSTLWFEWTKSENNITIYGEPNNNNNTNSPNNEGDPKSTQVILPNKTYFKDYNQTYLDRITESIKTNNQKVNTDLMLKSTYGLLTKIIDKHSKDYISLFDACNKLNIPVSCGENWRSKAISGLRFVKDGVSSGVNAVTEPFLIAGIVLFVLPVWFGLKTVTKTVSPLAYLTNRGGGTRKLNKKSKRRFTLRN